MTNMIFASGCSSPIPMELNDRRFAELDSSLNRLLKYGAAMPDMQRRVHGIVNKAVFARKKHRAFLVSQAGVKAFYQSVGRPFSVGNFPKNQRGFRVVGSCVGGKRIKRLLSGWRQKGFILPHFANAQRGEDVAASKYGVQGDVGRISDVYGHKKAFDHGCAPIVVDGAKTAREIWQMLYGVEAGF